MGKLTCACLNVKICIKNSELCPLDTAQLGIDPEHSHKFFSLKISEVQLNLEGIKVEHPSLLRKHSSSAWLVHECVNCKMFTHAVHTAQSNNNNVLVNTDLKSDSTMIESLSHSAEYSPLYRILLGSRVDNRTQQLHRLGVESGKYEVLQRTLTTIQQQLNKFLIDEESAMEERIRHYEQSQRTSYAELQSKARRDKNTLINLVLAAEQFQEREVERSTTGTETSPLSQPEKSQRVVRRRTPPPSPDTVNSNHSTPAPPATVPRTKHSQPSVVRPAPPATRQYFSEDGDHGSPDADGVFDFDPAFTDEPDRPFYESEEETEDTDDSSVAEESEHPYHPRHHNTHQQQQRNNKSLFSTSVPISMPVWQTTTSQRNFELKQHDEREAAPDMENMAASIKALARSVHGDGTEMFGERPRPRIHMTDFGNV